VGTGPINTPTYNNCFGAYGGKLYTFSGDLNAELWQGDTANLTTWTKKTNGALAKDDAAGCFCKGKFYVHGGYDTGGSNTTNNVMRAYDPSKNTWAGVAAGPVKRASHAMENLNDQIYLFGGYSATSGDLLLDLWRYNPTSNAWVRLADAPSTRRAFGLAAADGKVYVYGGYTLPGLTTTDGFMVYDVATNTWSTLPNTPGPRFQCTLTALNGKIYLFGGQLSSTYYNELWVFDPVVGEWTLLTPAAPLPAARRWHHAAVQQNKLVIYGGYTGAVNREVWVYTPPA
jgi:N-acetylneuraminic acid mutarotase